MKTHFLRLRPSEEVAQRLRSLRGAFSRAVELAWGVGREQGCTSRVALHHLAYEAIRKSEPQLGAQLTCNAIYLASAYLKLAKTRQKPSQPTAVQPSPNFSQVPVYLDKHTLTMKGDLLSIFTLDGRAKLSISLPHKLQTVFSSTPVKEILLIERKEGFILVFIFKTHVTDAPAKPIAIAKEPALRELQQVA